MNDFCFISSTDPNGVTYALNIFLELGIRIEVSKDYSLWKESEDGFYFDPTHHRELPKWLPALTQERKFSFEKNKVVFWQHSFPYNYVNVSRNIVLFVRDPRDSLFSSKRRNYPNLEFASYLNSVDAEVFLPRIQAWKLFYRGWLDSGAFTIQRFEDLKINSVEEVEKLLKLLDLSRSELEINSALDASKSERAAEGELQFRNHSSKEVRKVNFGGRPYEWILDSSRINLSECIANKLCNELTLFGYLEEPEKNEKIQWRYSNTVALPSFEMFFAKHRNIYFRKDLSFRRLVRTLYFYRFKENYTLPQLVNYLQRFGRILNILNPKLGGVISHIMPLVQMTTNFRKCQTKVK